jgi:prolyl-tRNA synthetase
MRNDPAEIEHCEMGCYGIGISRLLAAIAEVSHTKEGIIWPEQLAPYQCMVVQPSKLRSGGLEDVYDSIAVCLGGTDNVILEDRNSTSYNHRVECAIKAGYPYVVTLSFKEEGHVDVLKRKTGETKTVSREQVADPQFWKDLAVGK